jgi:DNA-binding LacI/PurR family transcriptional regulator
VGFDDIPGAAYANPGLTTVRQPLQRMGQIAARCVVEQIEGACEYVPEIAIEPELIVRASSGPAPTLFGRAALDSAASRSSRD